MPHSRLTVKARDKRILIERFEAGPDGFGQSTINAQPFEIARPWANIAFGSGAEQREAAQHGGAQTASFAVLATSETSAAGVRNRIRFPIADPDPEKWPIWEIQAVARLGYNEGFDFTATRVAT